MDEMANQNTNRFCTIHNSKSHNTLECKSTPNSNKSSNPNVKNRNIKHCTFHNSSTHSNEECKAQKSNTNYNKKKFEPNNTINYLLKEDSDTRLFTLAGNAFNVDFKMLVDSGSTDTLISRSLFEKLNLPLEKIPEWKAETANSKIINSSEGTCFDFYIEGNTTVKYNCRAKIVKGLNTNFIIGADFLTQNQALLDYKNRTISLSNYTYQNSSEITELSSKVNTTLKLKNDLEKVVHTFKRNNPQLETIPNVSHRIPLSNNNPIKLKPYRIPYALYEKTNEELSRLLKLKVIQPSTSLYASPAYPLLKNNGKIRLVNDYKALNAITVP